MDYYRGLELLRYQLENTRSFAAFLTLEARLLENLSAEAQFGSSENRRSERSEVVFQLNTLALQALDVTFNDLCLGREPMTALARSTSLRREVLSQLTPTSIKPPVRPLLLELPLGELSWQQFEALCAALVAAQPSVIDCHLQGGQGDAQEGIDIVATQRGETGNETWVYQCKRYDRFSPALLKAAFAKMTYPADIYVLMISTHANAALRGATEELRKGFLWDALDISRKLKNYPALVEDFFGPIWRADFSPPFTER